MEQLIQELNLDREALNESADVTIERLAELAGVSKPKKFDQIADMPKVKSVEELAAVNEDEEEDCN